MLARLLVSFSLLLITGCAGTHVYNQANHQTATKTETAFREAKIGDLVSGERELLRTMATNEQAIARRQALTSRNSEVQSVLSQANAGDAWNTLEKLIGDREKKLTSLSRT